MIITKVKLHKNQKKKTRTINANRKFITPETISCDAMYKARRNLMFRTRHIKIGVSFACIILMLGFLEIQTHDKYMDGYISKIKYGTQSQCGR